MIVGEADVTPLTDPTTELPLHPDVAPMAFLLGTWEGEGAGEYPTIEPFTYNEQIRFWHVGKPFLAYAQRTWHPDRGPMHGESGYWRPVGDGRIEIVMAHPTGVVEVQEGTIDGTTIAVASTAVARTSTAKEVTSLERTFSVEGEVLRYELRMAAVGRALARHLRAELRRT